MIVAMTMRLSASSHYDEVRDAISHDWIRFLQQFGITPILIPNCVDNPADFLKTINATHLLLTGGDSIVSLPNSSDGISPSLRDENEYKCLAAAIERKIPVLGICRGLQIINLYFGGQLTRNIDGHSGHSGKSHPVRLDDTDTVLTVNSFHNDGVQFSGMSNLLTAFAISDDQYVEGLRHIEKPIMAIQWHPERESYCPEFDKRLIEEWLAL
jgi:putative glutamine amidotransferase